MAQPAGEAPPANPAPARVGRQQQQQGGFGQSLSGIIRMAVIWYFAMKFFAPKKPSEPSIPISNLFQKGELLDMWLYVSEHEKFNDFGNEDALVWHETNIPYAVWGPAGTRTHSLKYFPSEAVKHNGSLYAHVFFARSGYPADPNDPEYQQLSAFGKTHSIVVYLPKPKDDKKRSLLKNSKDLGEQEPSPVVKDDSQLESMEEGPVEWISYWKPNITINLLDDFTKYSHNAIPPNVAGRIHDAGILSKFYVFAS